MSRNILICPIGYTVSYSEVEYHYENKNIRDWLSSRALLKLKFGKDWKNTHIIAIYPDNEGAKKSFFEGWRPKDENNRNNFAREAIVDIFSECASFDYITVRDEDFIADDELSVMMGKLFELIRDIAHQIQSRTKSKVKIIYDLTHSYRHLSFGALLQSIFLSDFDPNLFNIDEIYYASGKSPLSRKSKLNYVNLSSFVGLVKDTGTISNSIEQLHPKKLYDLAVKYNKMYKNLLREGTRASYLKWMSKNLDDLVDNLTQIQIGLCFEEFFVNIEKIQSRKYEEELQPIEIVTSIIYSHLTESITNFLNEFRKDEAWGDLSFRQIQLAEISLNKQFDLIRSYSYMREGVITKFVELLFGEDNENTVVDNRKIVSVALGKLTRDAGKGIYPPNVEKFSKLYKDIIMRRNSYAHVYSGRSKSTTSLSYPKHLKHNTKFLKQLNRMMEETQIIKSTSNFIQEKNFLLED